MWSLASNLCQENSQPQRVSHHARPSNSPPLYSEGCGSYLRPSPRHRDSRCGPQLVEGRCEPPPLRRALSRLSCSGQQPSCHWECRGASRPCGPPIRDTCSTRMGTLPSKKVAAKLFILQGGAEPSQLLSGTWPTEPRDPMGAC